MNIQYRDRDMILLILLKTSFSIASKANVYPLTKNWENLPLQPTILPARGPTPSTPLNISLSHTLSKIISRSRY